MTVTRYKLTDGTVILRLDSLKGKRLYYRLPDSDWEPAVLADIENMPMEGLASEAKTF